MRAPRVSQQVSPHADLVRYDVTHSDGANVGFNPPQTVSPGEELTSVWRATRPPGPNVNAGEPLGPVLPQDGLRLYLQGNVNFPLAGVVLPLAHRSAPGLLRVRHQLRHGADLRAPPLLRVVPDVQDAGGPC